MARRDNDDNSDKSDQRDGDVQRGGAASSASPMSTAAALSTEDETIVAAFDTVLEAEMARGRLEVEDIPARIVDGNTVGIAAHLSMALGGAKLVIGVSDLEAARAILFAPSAFADEFVDVQPRDDDRGGPLITHADADAGRALKSAILGLIFIPPVGHLWSLYLLTRVVRRTDTLTGDGRRQAITALVIDSVAVAGTALLVVKMLSAV